MPHSTAPEIALSPEDIAEDSILPDAPRSLNNEEEDAENEGSNDGECPNNDLSKTSLETGMKLEDLFDDEDEDEEFPSSSIPDAKAKSSPSAVPV